MRGIKKMKAIYPICGYISLLYQMNFMAIKMVHSKYNFLFLRFFQPSLTSLPFFILFSPSTLFFASTERRPVCLPSHSHDNEDGNIMFLEKTETQ